jgi:hypothetical protein
MVRGQDDVCDVTSEQLRLELLRNRERRLRPVMGDRYVAVPAIQHLESLVRMGLDEADLEVGFSRSQVGEHARQQSARRCRERRHPHRSVHRTPHSFKRRFTYLEFRENDVGAVGEQLTGRGQSNAAAVRLEQHRLGLALEPVELLRDGRRGVAECCRRGRD